MTRLKKELVTKNIILITDEIVAITDKFIITVAYSGVLEPVFYIYDRHTFELIGEQELYKDTQLFSVSNPWHSFIY
jgi:hypothetical protein